MSVGHGSVATPGGLARDRARPIAASAGCPGARSSSPPVRSRRPGSRWVTAAADYLEHAREPVFGWHPETRSALHHADGRPLALGDRCGSAGWRTSSTRSPPWGRTCSIAGRSPARSRRTWPSTVAWSPRRTWRRTDRRSGPPCRSASAGGSWAPTRHRSIGGPVLAAMLLLMDGRPNGEWSVGDVERLIAVQLAVLRAPRGGPGRRARAGGSAEPVCWTACSAPGRGGCAVRRPPCTSPWWTPRGRPAR